MQKPYTLLALAAGLTLGGAAQAALHDRGGGLIYDDVLNVTWLADANYAQTSGYDADGYMTWDQAMTWAANLSYYDSVRNVTWDDWRLPTIFDTGTSGCNYAYSTYSGTDCGYNVQTVNTGTTPVTVYSELAHMYYNNLGFKSAYSPTGDYQPDFGIFGNGTFGGERDGLGPNGAINNLQSSVYWSGTEYAPYTYYAWNFYTYNGYQAFGNMTDAFYAWAVRPGDVAAVPEPEMYALLLAGLGVIGLAVRRRG
jgi:hypothetical protein